MPLRCKLILICLSEMLIRWLGREYQSQLESAINYADPATWCDMFNSWDELNLMDDIKAGEHYHLLSQQNWTKLKQAFGGGPEIPFFQY